MVIQVYRAVGSIIFLFLSTTVLFAQVECELKKDQDSIKVYSCSTEASKFKSIKASFVVNATAPQLAAMVMDIAGYNDWQYKTINAKILKWINKQELIYYVEIVAPWPVSNRDVIVHLKVEQDPLTKKMIFMANGMPDYIPEKEGITRVPMSKSKWVVVPISSNKLKVEYSMNIDPSGSVPAWMVNMVSAEGPFESFYTLKSKIKERNYTKADAPFIID
ncbi:MAG: START domain-containing protein [Chryseolinea sp.]